MDDDIRYMVKLMDWAAGEGFCLVGGGIPDPDVTCAAMWERFDPENGKGDYSPDKLADFMLAAWNTRPTDTDADVEQSAQNWIEATYANYNFDPADRDYSTDDLVDAFMAGHATLQARVDALEVENAGLREAAQKARTLGDGLADTMTKMSLIRTGGITVEEDAALRAWDEFSFSEARTRTGAAT